jgi:nucleotide sugar dehydrogenase
MVKSICIVGQGYVGLPLSLAAAEAGYFVTGIDSDIEKVRKLNEFKTTIEEISELRIKSAINSGNYVIQDKAGFDNETEVILVCVPTPLNEERNPDLAILMSAVKSIGKSLKPGMLVIIESTIQPGVTRNVVLPELMAASNLKSE